MLFIATKYDAHRHHFLFDARIQLYMCNGCCFSSSTDIHSFDPLQRHGRIKRLNIYVSEINFQNFSLSSWECLDTSIMTKRSPTFQMDGKKQRIEQKRKEKIDELSS